MAELKIEVFTSPTCPACPSAIKATKELLKENKQLGGRVKWVEMSTGTPKGSKRARRYGIRGVPTIIITNRRGEKGGITGTPSKRKYLEVVYKMLGETPPVQKDEKSKPGLLTKLFGGRMVDGGEK